MDDFEDYAKGAYLVGIPVFLGCWAFAVASYGWFLGLGLGWIPAAFIGIIAGLLWPLVVLLIGGMVLLVIFNK